MNTIIKNTTSPNLARAKFWLFITILVYFLMNGAQIFETLVFVPKWIDSPPDGFNLLLDGRGASLKNFWVVFHSLHEITFVLAIVFCWRITSVRNGLLMLFVIHFAVRVWTLSYFAPSIIDFQKIAENPSSVEHLVGRASRWQTLNYVRVSIFITVSFGFIPLYTRLSKLE